MQRRVDHRCRCTHQRHAVFATLQAQRVGQALRGQHVFATLRKGFAQRFPRRGAGTRGDGFVQERIGRVPLLLRQRDAALGQSQGGRVVVHVAPALQVGLARGQTFGRQTAIHGHQFVIPAVVQSLLKRQQCRFVPVQCNCTGGVGSNHVRCRSQRLRRGFPLRSKGVDVARFQQCLRGQACFQLAAGLGRQHLGLAQRAQLAVSLVRAASTCQRFGTQPQTTRRQRLDRRHIQCVDRIHRQIVGQQLFGTQQCLQGRIAFAQALQQRLGSGCIGPHLRAAHGIGQGNPAHFGILGGAIQQLLGALPLAMLIGQQTIDQAHPALLAAVAAPGTERCGDQAPQQPQHQHADHRQQRYLRQVAVVVVAAIAQGHFAVAVQVIGAEPLRGNYANGHCQQQHDQ